jgi:hypothetical protein
MAANGPVGLISFDDVHLDPIELKESGSASMPAQLQRPRETLDSVVLRAKRKAIMIHRTPIVAGLQVNEI